LKEVEKSRKEIELATVLPSIYATAATNTTSFQHNFDSSLE